MPEVVFSVDQSKSMADQAVPGHNRWHPDIPPAASVAPGSDFRVECREWTDAQLGNNDSANDVRDVDLTSATCSAARSRSRAPNQATCWWSTSSISARSRRRRSAGDAPGQGWGYTGVFAKVNGGGFLTDHFPDAYKAIWDFHGQDATSRHLPGVRYTGITHPGLFGTAPSAELLAEWNRREQALIDKDPDRVPPLALPPLEDGTLAGHTVTARSSTASAARARARFPRARTAATTTSRTSRAAAGSSTRCTCAGAKLSGGDLHFSQGDGEITFCGAIEMGGYIDFGVDLIKGGMNKYGVTTNPVLIPGRVEPRYSEFLTFIGVSVDETTGENYYLDASIAYRRACLNAIEYLRKFGYSGEQAYLLLGSAPIEGRISGVVDIPNACCSLYLPTAIFDFDVRPSQDGPTVGRARRGGEDQLGSCRSTRSSARAAGRSTSSGRWPRRAQRPRARRAAPAARRVFTPPGLALLARPVRRALDSRKRARTSPGRGGEARTPAAAPHAPDATVGALALESEESQRCFSGLFCCTSARCSS